MVKKLFFNHSVISMDWLLKTGQWFKERVFKCLLWIIGIVAVCTCASVFYTWQTAQTKASAPAKPTVVHSKVSGNVSDPMIEQLADISAKLANIERRSPSQTPLNLKSIHQILSDIKNQLGVLDKKNQMLKEQIESNVKQLQGEMQAIQKEMLTLIAQKMPHKFLPPEKLPFQVIDIANIQQNDIVTIRYAYKVFPLYTGDGIAGWELIQANSANQTAQFKNKDDEYVRIDLKTLGTARLVSSLETTSPSKRSANQANHYDAKAAKSITQKEGK